MNSHSENQQINSDSAVEVSGLTKVFDGLTAVDSIDFSIKKGEVFGFLGPNGSGKTTTIRMLCGILEPSGGSGHTLGFDIIKESEKIKEHIGYMSQKFSLYDDLTVTENLQFYAGLHSITKKARENRVEELIENSGLQDRRNQQAGNLSGGWKQRVALVCSMVHQPKLVFLDEPTAGVDPVSRRRFWEMIYKSADEGSTFLVTTHYMDEAEQFDKMIFIDRGKLIAQGTPDEIKKEQFPKKLWEIKCHPPSHAEKILRNAPEIFEVTIHGNLIHLTTAEDFTDTDGLKDLLTDNNIAVDSIKETEPSLEDVFISLETRNNPNNALN